MAKDDYDVLVFKILTYLYACAKRKTVYSDKDLYHAIGNDRGAINESWLNDVLRMAVNEGLIDGLTFEKAWANEYILISDLSDAYITSEGIHYLKENARMKKIKDDLIELVDPIATLITLVL